MSLLDNILGNNTNLTDKDIASDMLKDSKFGISTLSMAATEAVNPSLRQLIDTQLKVAVDDHHRLSDMMIKKNWYPAYDNPTQQLRNEVRESQNITR